jgi:hypothetical protein
VGRVNEESRQNWIYTNDQQDNGDFQLYISAFYFTVATIVTVGYGDISPANTLERCYVVILMLIGVVSFSFTTGALSSIISSYDSSQAKLKEKMATLRDINSEYSLNSELFKKLIRSINYDHNKKMRDFDFFMEELPYKLRIELALEIHKKIYETVEFFKNKDKSFVVWIVKFLRPIHVQEQEYIFKEGESI